MSVSGSRTVSIKAPLAEVLAAVRDIPGQPVWWPGMLSSDVLESDDEGRTTRARLVNDVKVVKDQFEVDYQHTDTTVSWTLVAPSKAQKEQDGSWTLVDKGGTTDATLDLTINSSLPLPGFVQKKILNDTLKGATEGLKKHLEN